MSVTPSTAASAIAKASSAYVQQLTGSSSDSSALAEATETPATTAKEAAKGDQVAKRLLAKEQAAQAAQAPESPQEPGKGELVDQKA